MGRTIVHVGGPGAGQTVKACNQIVVALTIEAVSEALVLGSKAGVDPEKILDVLGGGLAANRVMEMRRRNFLEHDFTPGFRVDLHHKDLNIALESGDAFGVSLPATSLAQQQFRALRAKGRGGDDHSALLTVIEEAGRAGHAPHEAHGRRRQSARGRGGDGRVRRPRRRDPPALRLAARVLASATSACATRRAARTRPTATRGSPASRGSRSARPARPART